MSKHLDVYMFSTFITTQYNVPPLARMDYAQQTLGFRIQPDSIELGIRSYAPKTASIVHWMKEHGYSPAFIAGYLGITPQGVSFHLKKPAPTDYVNIVWRNLQRAHEDQQKQSDDVYR